MYNIHNWKYICSHECHNQIKDKNSLLDITQILRILPSHNRDYETIYCVGKIILPI